MREMQFVRIAGCAMTAVFQAHSFRGTAGGLQAYLIEFVVKPLGTVFNLQAVDREYAGLVSHQLKPRKGPGRPGVPG